MPELVNKHEDWMNRKWRPAMGWLYFVVCITDFIIFPIAWTAYQTTMTGVVTAWDPLTLKGAGLFHMAMGAILGIAAWSRGQEKMRGVAGPEPQIEVVRDKENINTKSKPIQPNQPEL
jgi:hypothetical protein